jgi:tRNA(Arg) A34 adenosine deaminase TadA
MLSRRNLIGKLGGGLGIGLAAMISGAGRVLGADRRRFAARAASMRAAAIATGDQAYGAVVVKDGRIVGLGPSRVVVNTDPTGHAEMEALRAAARNLGTHDLSGCEMFTTSPPCRMCETAAYWANIRRVYTGPAASDRGRPGYGC